MREMIKLLKLRLGLLAKSTGETPNFYSWGMPVQNNNNQQINFVSFRVPVGNLQKINQNQKTSWNASTDCNSCFTHSIYTK